ncbi:MAG: type II secretion system protein GspD [Candidatus Hydrogenedentes bacterium]|nr:type II secretion system protein GspD [Candidatus Hydrogenedentota bacterium]
MKCLFKIVVLVTCIALELAGADCAIAQPAKTDALKATAPSPVAGGGSEIRDAYGSNIANDVTFQYDPETGSLIVITDEETNSYIQQIINRLDQPIPQVLINVLFLEVTHSSDLDLGVEGTFNYDGKNPADEDVLQTLFGVAAQVDGGFYKIIEDDFLVTMRALASVAKLEVLSRPSILARNNESATITIGKEVPFIRNSRITQDGQTINTVEYEDIGIILDVTPHITADRLVEMNVSPEISTLTGETVPISETLTAPVFAKRSAETRVVVPDGKTVVIGGLMEDNNTESVRKIPLLGDIPYLGALFRRTITDKSKTELLIFLTPHVVEGGRELANMTSDEKAKTRLAPEVFSDDRIKRYIDEQGQLNSTTR